MKLVLDLPSVLFGVVAGLLLGSSSFGARWLLNYDDVSVPAVGAAALFLAGVSAWLLLSRRPVPDAFSIRVNSFTPMLRPEEAPASGAEAPALRPMEWLEANDRAGESDWRVGAARDLAAQLTDSPARTALVRAVSAAICADMRGASAERSEIDNLAAVVASAEGAGVAPDFVSIADGLEGRYGNAALAFVDGFHLHAATRLAAVVDRAKRKGAPVAPVPRLRWLKRYDRVLWYGLQNVGRHAMFVEGAGISAHFTAEKKAERLIGDPQVEDAVRGLEDYLKKHGLIDKLGGTAEHAA